MLCQVPAEEQPKRHPAAASKLRARGQKPNPLAFDPDLAVFSAVVFLLLYWLLGKFAWPTIAAALDERERKIADNIAAAAARHRRRKADSG